ncbi:putative ribonuclease H-like domain-containing protein [Tanacetum coccineum]
MAREAEVKKQRVFNTGNGVAKPVWTNANRVNHSNKFVPRSVQLNAGRPNINSVRPNINTGRLKTILVQRSVKIIRSDNGTEFKNRDMLEFCGNKGIKHEYIINARTPQQNGVAERINRTLIEAARTMLADFSTYQPLFGQRELVIVVPLSVMITGSKNLNQESSTNSKKEEILTDPQQEKKVSSTDTLEDNPKIQAFRKELEEIALKHLGTVPENNSTSTPSVNTGSQTVNTGRLDPDDSPMPELEIFHKSETGIFDEASYNEEGVIIDFNSLPTKIEVSPTPTLRIHNIHPKSQILGDPKSAVQTRSKVQQKSGAHALLSYTQKQQRNNHKDQQHCLFACFLSQKEPKKIAEALQDDSWVQAMESHHIQDKYVAEILKKFDLVNVKTTITPMETKVALTKDEEAVDVDVTPKTLHLNAVKRIFKYLKGKPHLGLWYPRESPFDLEAFSDSDYGGSNLDRKSTTGGYQFLGQRLISWQCKKQTIVATSTTEAEYVSAANCCGQVLWVQNQLLDYGFNFMNTKIHIDNESTICIVKNPIYHSKTKHIEIRHHFIRDYYEKKLISVEKIHTDLNVADLLTKAFDGPRFNYLGGFAEIVDFLRGSNLRYALTSNPTIYDFLVKQFWQTATANTIADGTLVINATIDTIRYTITEASIRDTLHLADAIGITILPNDEIFEGMGQMGSKSGGWDQFGSNIATALICLSTDRVYNFSKLIFDGMVANLKSKTKFLMYPRFLQMILNIQTENKHLYLAVSLTKKIFGNMKRGFRGAPRPLLPAMLLVATNPNAGQEHDAVAQTQPSSSTPPVPSTSSPPVQSPPQIPASIPTPTPIPASIPSPTPIPETEPAPYEHTFEEPSPVHQHFSPPQEQAQGQMAMDDLLQVVPQLISRIDSLDTDLKQTNLTMGNSIVRLVKKVKKLEGFLKKRNVVLSDSEEEEPEAQGRKSQDDPLASLVQGMVTPSTTKVDASGEEQVEDISPNTLEAAKTLSRVASLKPKSIDKGRRYKRRKETKGKKVVSSLDFQEEVDTGAEQVNTAEGVNTGSIKLSTGSEQVSTVSAKKSTPSPDKGQRAGKAPMIIEETPKKSKEQILQEEASLAEAIRLDTLQKEEVAKQVHLDSLLAQRIAEEEELNEQQKKRKAQVQFEAQHYTDEDWDLIRAKIEANAELSKSMLGSDLQGEDFAKKMVDLVNQRKKYFAEERARAKRNKPMTQSQLKTYMMNYLKNQGTWKLFQLKNLSFEEVKEEFDKLVKQVESFAPINFEATKASLKRFGEELQTKTSKRLKSDEAKDDVPTKKSGKRRKQMARKGLHTDLDKDDSEDSEEVSEQDDSVSGTKTPINHVPVAIKSPSIATYKIIKQGEKGVYQIVREDGTDIVYINFGAMLKDISRDDLTELYRIVMNRYGMDGPEDELEKVFWKYLKNMFEEPLSTDPIWSLLSQQRIISWRYYDTCRVHCLNLESMDVYMLIERQYPLSAEICKAMLDKKLQGGKPDENCYKMLKMMEKQAGIRK